MSWIANRDRCQRAEWGIRQEMKWKNMISWARHKWSLDESNTKELEGQNLYFFFFSSQARHTGEKRFPPQFTHVPACLVNLSSHYGEISLAASLSSAGREPSISSSPPLNICPSQCANYFCNVKGSDSGSEPASVPLVPGCWCRTLSRTLCLTSSTCRVNYHTCANSWRIWFIITCLDLFWLLIHCFPSFRRMKFKVHNR